MPRSPLTNNIVPHPNLKARPKVSRVRYLSVLPSAVSVLRFPPEQQSLLTRRIASDRLPSEAPGLIPLSWERLSRSVPTANDGPRGP